MPRRLCNIAVVTSLVLFVVVMGLWVNAGSRFALARIDLPLNDSGSVEFTQCHGLMKFSWEKYSLPQNGIVEYIEVDNFRLFPPRGAGGLLPGLGIGHTPSERLFSVPHWLLALLTSILPVVWLIRRRRKRDPDAVPCAKCGYDLRGSLAVGNEICPECGSSG